MRYSLPDGDGSPDSRLFSEMPRLMSLDWNTSSTAFARSSLFALMRMDSPLHSTEASGALEVVALLDLLAGLVQGVVRLLLVDLGDDVERRVSHAEILVARESAETAEGSCTLIRHGISVDHHRTARRPRDHHVRPRAEPHPGDFARVREAAEGGDHRPRLPAPRAAGHLLRPRAGLPAAAGARRRHDDARRVARRHDGQPLQPPLPRRRRAEHLADGGELGHRRGHAARSSPTSRSPTSTRSTTSSACSGPRRSRCSRSCCSRSRSACSCGASGRASPTRMDKPVRIVSVVVLVVVIAGAVASNWALLVDNFAQPRRSSRSSSA